MEQLLFGLCAEAGAETLQYKMIGHNDYVVLAEKHNEFVTWRANTHPGCHGLHSGRYFRVDVFGNNRVKAMAAATTDYKERN